MDSFSKLYLFSVVFTIANHLTVQIIQEANTANVNQFYNANATIFEIVDGEKLFLDDNFCLKSTSVKAYLTNNTLVGEQKPSIRLDISWESEHPMISLEVRSDSVNDSYCKARDRFSYHRKPVKKNMHTFPDIVNYGPRYVPIKLDCKYIIIPEMAFPCLPLRLKYTTPACISGNVCSCRNVSLPAPELNVKLDPEGVTVHWKVVQKRVNEDIEKIFISIEPSHLSYNAEAQKKEYTTSTWENFIAKSGKHFFVLNSTYSNKYIIKALYVTIHGCSGNTTLSLFDFPEVNQGNYQFVLYLTYFLIIIILTTTAYLFRQKLGLPLCNKFFRVERRTTQTNEDVLQNREFQGLCANNPIYRSTFQDKDAYVIDYQQLIFKKKLAEGHFGIVYLAFSFEDIKGYKIFAVKQLKETATSVDVDDFLEEMNIFKNAGDHKHIVRMIGYCKTPQPLSIIMEYVPNNLLEYLKKLRNEYELNISTKAGRCQGKENIGQFHKTLPPNYTTMNEKESIPLNSKEEEELECALNNTELESFSLQIARGMAHLEAKNIVHRDLAARNILIDNYKTLKISDFGMSRTGVYVHKTNRVFPLRWMSPEAVTSGTFSNKSDVWSYGVVLWEIGTLGGLPYSDLHNDEVLSWIRKGGHPDQPECVTPPLHELMLSCWSYKPEDRPTFSELVHKIENLRQKAYVDFSNIKDYFEFPPTEDKYSG